MLDPGSVDLTENAYLSLGSNIGERETNVLRAARRIADEGIGHAVRVSPLYETDPVDCPPMARFVNAVVELRPLLCMGDLIKRLQALEKSLGRRGGHMEPREIDIDIVAFGTRTVETPDLIVPHPRYRKRSFVLVPLRDVAPAFQCPLTGAFIDELIAALPPGGRVSRISSRRIVFHD
jgi:2-amino-4-hydroxy-6-hydroxymethyldihydropteridine diphosphokinase